MIDPLTMATVGQIGGTALKAGFGLFSSWRQAQDERAATRETLRRMRAQNAQVLGEATALGAATEFGLSGSLPNYLQLVRQEMDRQVDWERRARDRATGLGLLSGVFGAVADVGGGINKIGAMNNWWQKKPAGGGGTLASAGTPSAAQPWWEVNVGGKGMLR
jgi:hypothetical protein